MADDMTAKPPRARTWVRILLGVSLALNLAVIGLAIGAAVRFGGPDGAHRPSPPMGAILYRELPREDRKALRGRAFGSREEHAAKRRDEAVAIDAALRAVPFDAAALGAFLDRQARDREAFQSAVQEAWLARVSGMSDAERAAYADRLMQAAKHADARKWDRKHKDD